MQNDSLAGPPELGTLRGLALDSLFTGSAFEMVEFAIQRLPHTPPGWTLLSCALLDETKRTNDVRYEFFGAVCNTRYVRGPKKGQINFNKREKGTSCSFVMSEAMVTLCFREWEQRKGLCSDCSGRGQKIVRFSADQSPNGQQPPRGGDDGLEYGTCSSCGGTGKPRRLH